jgi:hypothetical protein
MCSALRPAAQMGARAPSARAIRLRGAENNWRDVA